MRISDWSSDVCSSDLAGCGWRGNWAAHYLHGDPMADHFIQGSFAFTCSIAEAALIEEAWQLAADLMGDFDPAHISDELLAVFPPSLADKQLSGLTTIFDVAHFPAFGSHFQYANSIGEHTTFPVSIFNQLGKSEVR